MEEDLRDRGPERDWDRVKDVLARVRKCPKGDRGALLRELLHDAPDLIPQVVSLLGADERPAAVLREMDAALEGAGAITETGSEGLDPLQAGTELGPYRLVRRVGGGGMGDVWLADQTYPLRRRVAVKVVRLGMDTRQVVRRFEQERQALALMDHPNIARVYDAGAAPSGRPYFVMEFVQGRQILDFCDSERLDTRARLELFLQVCRAAQHAHQKGVLHRDLKPSNMMVQLHGSRPTVKVIDFGIAKALGPSITSESVDTQIDQVLGTPDYMSPEQADPDSRDVDTRADIYSLGIVLYELLTGARPHRAASRSAWAFAHQLREAQTPPPSRLLTSATQETVARDRSTTPGALRRELVGDLDWIVLKAIEKDRGRRYATVNELAQDIERYLRSEPVLARGPSALYRMSRFARRHRGGVAAAGLAALAIVSGTVIASVGWARAAAEARVSTSRAVSASAIRQLESDPELGLLLAIEAAEIAPTPEAEDALDRALDSRILGTIEHGEPLQSAVLSPDGRRVAAVTRGGGVRVVDLETEETLLSLEEARATQVAFDPTGRRFATAELGGRVGVWNAGTGERLLDIAAADGRYVFVAFDPNGRWLASAGDDGNVGIWDVETGDRRWDVPRMPTALGAVAVDPAGTRVAVAGADMTVRILSTSDGRTLTTLPPPPGTDLDGPQGRASLVALAFDPDGRRLAASGTNGVHVWEVETGTLVAARDDLFPAPYALAFDPGGRRLAVGGTDRVGRVLSAATGAPILTLVGHTNTVLGMAFTPDGHGVVTHSSDGTTRLWNVAQGAARMEMPGHDDQVWRVEYARDGSSMASVALDGTARIYDAGTGEERTTLHAPGPLGSMAYTPDGRRLATGGSRGGVTVWDVRTGLEILTVDGVEPPVMGLAFGRDGLVLVAGGWVEGLRSAETGALAQTWAEGPIRARAVTFAAGGSVVVTTDGGNTAEIRDPASGRIRQVLDGHDGGVEDLAASPDGRWVATASLDGTARVWDVASGQMLMVFRGHRDRVYGVAFSPDGRRLVTGSGDGTAKVWDVSTGVEILTLNAGPGIVHDVDFSADGSAVALGEFGRVRVFPADLGSLLAAARSRAGRSLTPAECIRFVRREGCA